MFTCDKNFGECLEDAARQVLEVYSAGNPSGRRLLAMLEKLVADAQPIAVDLDDLDVFIG